MGKGIVRIYKYDQQNYPYSYPTTTSVIPPRFDTSIQTQCSSASDTSTGENDVALTGLDQNTNHHGNTDSKDNYDSQIYDTP